MESSLEFYQEMGGMNMFARNLNWDFGRINIFIRNRTGKYKE